MSDKFVRIKKDNQIYYGGDQKWFSKKRNQSMGCGIIAAANLMISIGAKSDQRDTMDYDEYIHLAEELGRRYIHVLPKLGINGVFLSIGINWYFRNHHIPIKTKWGTGRKKIWTEIERMLDENGAVILAIGPNNFGMFRNKRLPLYVKRGNTYVCETSTKAHYVSVTGIDDDYLTISSWGKKFYIHKNEFMMYVRKYSNFLFSNVLVTKTILQRSNSCME